MYWLFLLLAIVAFVVALGATSTWLLLLSLVASLGFFLLWLRGLYVARIGDTFSQMPRELHPAELQILREQLRGTSGAPTPAPTSPLSAPVSPPGPPIDQPAPRP